MPETDFLPYGRQTIEEDDIAHFSGRRVQVARIEDLIGALEHSAEL